MKYIEKYLEEVIKIKPLGHITTKEDYEHDLSGEMLYIDGKCTDIFISHADYANWLEKQVQKPQSCWKPSEEQITILNEILNFAANHESPYWNDYIFGTLNNLIRQLKKLTE